MSESMYSFFLHLHSIGRWIVLLLLVVAIFNSMVAGSRPFIRSDARTGTILVIFADLIFLVGLALFFLGGRGYKIYEAMGSFSSVMKGSAETRFFAFEHPVMMLI